MDGCGETVLMGATNQDYWLCRLLSKTLMGKE